MNILLGADSLGTQRSGVGRMTAEIARAILQHPDVNGMRLLVGDRDHGAEFLDAASPSAHQGPRPWRTLLQAIPAARALRERAVRRRLRAIAEALGTPTLYYEPNMIAKPFDGPTVAGFNDLSWRHHPEAHPADRVAWIERRLPSTLRQARRFVAISGFTARAMHTELGIAADRIDVVPLAPGSVFRPIDAATAAPVLERLGLPDQGYVLSVSTLEPRKNFDGLLAAWSALPRPRKTLVIVGAPGWGAVLDGTLARAALADGSLRLPGHVPDADLCALYARCAAFAYVSHYEGFGLPLLEAMAAGAPVLSASTTACGETAGDAALLVDPADTAAITEGLRRLLDDPAAAAELRRRGADRAAGYSWARTAELLVRSWRAALT